MSSGTAGLVILVSGIVAYGWIFKQSGELNRARQSEPKLGRLTISERLRSFERMVSACREGRVSVWLAIYATVATVLGVLLLGATDR